jgi:hypothetical protein
MKCTIVDVFDPLKVEILLTVDNGVSISKSVLSVEYIEGRNEENDESDATLL